MRDHSKKLNNQIVSICNSVIMMIAPKQSATVLRRNLMQANGSPEQQKHVDPPQLRLIQRHVQSVWQELTKRNLDVETVPETLGELAACCTTQDIPIGTVPHYEDIQQVAVCSLPNSKAVCSPHCRYSQASIGRR